MDKIIIGLDSALNKVGVPDDKIYANKKYFFSNMTLARFNTASSDEFKKKIQKLSDSISLKPYKVDTVTLLTCNAVCKKKIIYNNWQLL